MMYSLIIPVVLITLTAGYWVLTKAAREEKNLKLLGNIFGWLIIVLSLIMLVMAVYYSHSCRPYKGQGMMMGNKMMYNMQDTKHQSMNQCPKCGYNFKSMMGTEKTEEKDSK